MKSVKILGTIILGIILLQSLTGCGKNNELTRERAKGIIVKKLNYPRNLVTDITIGKNIVLMNPQKAISLYKALANVGVISLTQHRTIMGIPYVVQITNEGKKYVQKIDNDQASVILGKLKFAEITGIILSPGGKEAAVEYREKLDDVTPFGKIIGTNYDFSRKARFVLYDDGWRMVEKNIY